MRKSVFIVTLSALMFSASVWAQKIAPRCRTCGRKLTECQYKGHHPSKNSSPDKNNKPAKVRPQRHNNNSVAPKTIQFADGIYTGNIVNGVRVGNGTFKYNNGDFYDGHWKNNKRNGYGTCEYKNGDTFEGYWKDDAFEMGSFTYINGDQYRGSWKDGKLNGNGEYHLSNSSYKGGFKDGKKDGRGLLINIGDTIVGEYKNDNLNGYAYKRTKDGTRIMNMFTDGVPNGFCIIDAADGTTSYLYIKNGKKEGPGIVIMPDNTISGVIYSNDNVVNTNTHKVVTETRFYDDLGAPDFSNIRSKIPNTEFGEIIYGSGFVYIGDFFSPSVIATLEALRGKKGIAAMAEELNKHVPHGFGIMVSPSKDVYIGTFVHGLREGHGAYVSFNKGTCTYGQWHNDKENGFCTTVYGYFK